MVCAFLWDGQIHIAPHKDQNTEMELSDCLPWYLDGLLLLFMTPMLWATDQIRDTVRQMSALVLCSRHECCWHTHQSKREGGKRREQGGYRGSMVWKRTGEKRDERGRGQMQGEGVCPRKSDVTPHRLHRQDEIYSVMFLSDSSVREWHYKFRHSPWLTWGRIRRPHMHF